MHERFSSSRFTVAGRRSVRFLVGVCRRFILNRSMRNGEISSSEYLPNNVIKLVERYTSSRHVRLLAFDQGKKVLTTKSRTSVHLQSSRMCLRKQNRGLRLPRVLPGP